MARRQPRQGTRQRRPAEDRAITLQPAGQRSFWVTLAIAAVCYTIVSLVITFPLILDLGGSIVATPGDPLGALYSLWLSVREPIQSAFPHAPVLVWTGAFLTSLVGEVLAYNLMVLGGFVLTGLAGFILGHQLTRSLAGSFITGFILLVAPYHVAQALQHVGLANLHWLLLFLASLLWFDERPSILRGLLWAVSFAVTMLDSYLYGIFALLVAGLFGTWRFLHWLAHRPRRPAWRVAQWGMLLLSLGFGFALVVPALSPVLRSLVSAQEAAVALVRNGTSTVELAAFSARGFAYLLPPPDNILFGDLTRSRYTSAFSEGTNATELAIYLGWVTLGLALIGLVGLCRRPVLPPAARRWASFWILLGLVGLYTSFAPTIRLGPLELGTPGLLFYDLIPLLRVYSRFGLLVLIAAAILAGFGIAWLASRLRDLRHRWALVGLATLLLLADLLVLPTDRTIAVGPADAPAVYQWLARSDEVGRVAEYPMLPPDEPVGYEYLLWARVHGRPVQNLTYIQTGDAEERALLADLNREATLSELRALGVTHVLIHTHLYSPERAKKYPLEYNGGAPVYLSPHEPGVSIVGTFGETNVYRIQ